MELWYQATMVLSSWSLTAPLMGSPVNLPCGVVSIKLLMFVWTHIDWWRNMGAKELDSNSELWNPTFGSVVVKPPMDGGFIFGV